MAAGAWKDWAEGELVTEALFQDIQDSIAFIYSSESAANTALTNKVTGTQFYDTTDLVLKIWNGSSWDKVGGGLSDFDCWNLTANKTSSGDITANLARPTGTGQGGYLGTGMTQSSGEFTFPGAGYWIVHYTATMSITSGDGFLEFQVFTSSNSGSSYDQIVGQSEGSHGGTSGGTVAGQVLLDVTDASTFRIKFAGDSISSGSYIIGTTVETATGFTFMRLADT